MVLASAIHVAAYMHNYGKITVYDNYAVTFLTMDCSTCILSVIRVLKFRKSTLLHN